VGPVFFPLFSPAQEVSGDKTTAKHNDGEVHEEFKTLCIPQMQP
jgi:hypothetical protein